MSGILSLDLGTKTGWCINDPSGPSGGTWDLTPGRYDSRSMRFVRFRQRLNELAGAYCVERVVFEEVRRHLGTQAAHVYGGFFAVLSEWCDGRELPYVGVPVSKIKKYATGKGNAPKSAMIAACRERLGVDPADDNEADARWLLALEIGRGGAK